MVMMINYLIKKFLNRREGSLTVEGAIVLPLFISVVLTIGFFIKVVHTHEVMQYAIDETANDLASSSYIYYSTGLYEIEENFYNQVNDRKNKLQGQKETLKEIPNVINKKEEDYSKDIKKISTGVDNKDGEELLNTIDEMLQTGNSSVSYIKKIYDLINSIKEDGISGNIKNLMAESELEEYQHIKTQIGNAIVKSQIRKHLLSGDEQNLEKRLRGLHIYGLDFSQSNYLYGNDEIEIIVSYEMDLHLPFDFIGKIPMVQRSTARAWLGGTNPASIIEVSKEKNSENIEKDTKETELNEGNSNKENTKKNEKDEKEEEEKVIYVYITDTGGKYHKDNCRYLWNSKIKVKKKDAKQGGYEPCKRCY